MAQQNQEAFLVVGVDAKNRLVGSRLVSLGTLTQSLVHPREVFHPILAMRAAGFILAHNHPSGDPAPSPEDNLVTVLAGRPGPEVTAGRALLDGADLLALPLIDHLIVGKERYFSYADADWPGVKT